MARTLYITGLAFFLLGMALTLPSLTAAAGSVEIGDRTIESYPSQAGELFTIANLASLGAALWVAGSVFFCSGAIVSAINRRP